MPNGCQTEEQTPTDYGPLVDDCCSQPGDNVKGTLFFGGAGMDGGYIPRMVKALRTSGICSAVYVDQTKWSGGTGLDAVVGVLGGRSYDPRFPMLLRNLPGEGSQFNLIGYSYGSLVAAQVAMKYAIGGTKIDHVVLIGSPISHEFLEQIRKHPNIKSVLVVNLDSQGDPIIAGMSRFHLMRSVPTLINQMREGKGHFFYAPDTPEGQVRRRELAQKLFEAGLR